MSADRAAIARWLRDADAIVVLTGAGISTESGIPDFRGPDGIWTKNPAAEKTATLRHYVSDPAVRVQAWQNRIHGNYWTAEPNAGHRALADLERRAALDTLVTQNVDGLHHKAGNSPDKIVEIHGNVREVKCMSCGARAPMERALARVRAGDDDPACIDCGGILKSATISFGENLDPDVIERAQMIAGSVNVFLVVGSSLSVYPAAGLAPLASRSGARLVIINLEPTTYDDMADAVLPGNTSEVLQAIAAG